MKIFKLSHGKEFFDDEKIKLLKKNNLVSVHPNTSAKGQSSKSQGQEFLTANKGDLFYLCRSNDTIELIGMLIDERPLFSALPEHKDWVEREYVLILDSIHSSAYNKSLDKWWTPKNNSTFIEISKSDVSLFENEILKPVFDIDMEVLISMRDIELNKVSIKMHEYLIMQSEYHSLIHNEKSLFDKINSIPFTELKKLEYSYKKRGDISKQPVVLLRSRLLELLIQGDKLNASIINQTKNVLAASFDTNVYHAWSSNFRILYTFLFEKYKTDLEFYFKELIKRVQIDLDIENETKVKLVHFDGPQNQGNDRVWFAIYNKVNKSQKMAKQLFFEIFNGLNYGLLNHGDKSKNQIKNTNVFVYQDLLKTFKKFKQEILNDNSMEKAKIAEYSDILAYKKQIILQGPPGTGKTYTAKDIAEQIITGNISYDKIEQGKILKKSDQYEIVQFHPSYTYEDFVRGIVVKSEDGQIKYETENKVFGELIQRANEGERRAKIKSNLINIIKDYGEELQVEIDNKKEVLLSNSSRPLKGFNGESFKYTTLSNEKEIARYIKVSEVVQCMLAKVDNASEVNEVLGTKTHGGYLLSLINLIKNHSKESIDNLIEQVNTYSYDIKKKYVLIVDEINRANLPSVLGELIYALEYRDKSVDSMYKIDGDSSLIIPSNLYIIGTMNTADRSVGHIDYAIRRRFAFIELLPKELTSLGDKFKIEDFKKVSSFFVKEIKSNGIYLEASEHLNPEFAERPQDVWIGHSYFIVQEDENGDEIDFNLRLQYEVVPILEEYVKDGILKNTEEVKKKIKSLIK